MICTPCLQRVFKNILAQSVEYVFIPVVHIGLGQHEIQNFPSFVDDEVQLETEIPSHGTFSDNSIVLEYPVAFYTLVMTDGDTCAIHKTYPCTTAEAAHL